jgi:hypothetical protein
VRQINQRSAFVGVPAQVKYYLFNTIQPRWYVKAGLDAGFRITNTNEVKMYDREMAIYKEEVAAKFPQPGRFMSSLYAAGGVRLGNIEKISFNIEAVLPSVMLSRKSTGMVTPIAGGGFQFSFQIPI